MNRRDAEVAKGGDHQDPEVGAVRSGSLGELGVWAVHKDQVMNRRDAEVAKEGERHEPGERIDALATLVIGAAIEVHRALGPGFLEGVYRDALAVELRLRAVPFECEKRVATQYKGHSVGEGRLDLLVGSCLVVELKTVDLLAPIHTAQVLSYLKTLRLPLGLLINFNVPVLKHGIKRVILSESLGDLAVYEGKS